MFSIYVRVSKPWPLAIGQGAPVRIVRSLPMQPATRCQTSIFAFSPEYTRTVIVCARVIRFGYHATPWVRFVTKRDKQLFQLNRIIWLYSYNPHSDLLFFCGNESLRWRIREVCIIVCVWSTMRRIHIIWLSIACTMKPFSNHEMV